MKKRPFLLIVAVSALVLGASVYADDRTSFELGFQNAVRSHDGLATRILPYVEGHMDRSFDTDTAQWTFESGLRLQNDFENLDRPSGSAELSVRALSLTYAQGPARVELGFQEIPWGESFGFQIADIVNPRDWRDPLFLDSSWVRLPVFALQNQFFFDSFTFQTIFTPVARNNQLPEDGSPFDPSLIAPTGQQPRLEEPVKREIGDFPGDSEFGGKLGYLFSSGLDLSVFVFRHFSRTPVYELRTSPSLSLVPIVDRVTTFGSSFSFAHDAWVFRADSLINSGQPLQIGLGTVERNRSQWQTVAGVDWTSPGGAWIFGAQYHGETDDYESGPFRLNWISTKVQARLPGDQLDAELFAFFGVDNPDLWIQPKLTWHMNAHWTGSLRYDWVKGGRSPEAGYLSVFENQSRALLWVSLKI